MEDLFYFTRAAVRLEDIARLAHRFGYRTKYVDLAEETLLSVLYSDEEWWEWTELSANKGDFDSFEPSDREIIDKSFPESSFMITHYALSWPILKRFLKAVLEEYDGWIGCDTKHFEPIYTAQNIDRTPYPLYTEARELVDRQQSDVC